MKTIKFTLLKRYVNVKGEKKSSKFPTFILNNFPDLNFKLKIKILIYGIE